MKHLLLMTTALLLLGGCRESFDEQLERKTAEESRRICPMEVEPNNRLDSMAYRPATRTLHYWYTLSGPLDTPEMHRTMTAGAGSLRAQLRQNIANSVELKEAKEHGVSFCYSYRSDSTGKTILQLSFQPRDYGR